MIDKYYKMLRNKLTMNKIDNITPQMVNTVTLTIRDKDTLEVKRTQEETNVVTLWAEYAKWLALESIKSGASTDSAWGIYLGDTPIAPGCKTCATDKNATPNVTITSINDVVQDWTWYDGSPDYAETTQRFNPPASPRTIHNISLGKGYNYVNDRGRSTFVSLTPPCTQGTSEVLDVTYRMQFYYQAPDPSSLPMVSDIGKILAKAFPITYDSDIDHKAIPFWTYPMWSDIPQNPELMRTTAWENTNIFNISSRVQNNDYFKITYNINRPVSYNVGQIMRSVAFGNMNSSYSIGGGHRSGIWSPLTRSDFPYKPIQPIHNHNANAVEPFLDVDYLATSQGSLTVNGDAWTNNDWPEFYRIEYSTTGDVGTSNYFIRQRNIIGFQGSSYEPTINAVTHYRNEHGPYKTITDGHGLSDRHKIICYTTDVIISWDTDGFTLINNNSGFVRNYDASSPIPFLGTGINTICVIGTDLWISCGSGGIYRMEDPMGTPTITKMSNTTNNLPIGGDTSCYAVAEGYATSLWVMCEGALAYSANPTDATPTFIEYTPLTTTPFDYTGITDGNWSSVKYMYVDKNHPDNNMAITLPNTNTTSMDIMWWSTAGVSTFCGTTAYGLNMFGIINVSAKGNEWAYIDNNTSYRLTWGETTASRVSLGPNTGRIDYRVSKITWAYDYYGNPYTFGGSSGGSYGSNALVRMDGKTLDTITDGYGQANVYDGGKLQIAEDGRGMLYVGRGYQEQDYVVDRVATITPFTYNDALNGQHTAFEEIMWHKYHWNGSSWENGYHAPALDTASHTGGPYNGTRHNFDTESHTFTGRSLIDASAAFAPGNFSSQATFTFKLYPGNKPSGANNIISKQETPQTVFEVADSVQTFKIMWDDSENNLALLVDEFIISSTPAPLNTYRLVVAVNGTSVDVYLNGTLVIPTVTLPNALNLTNVSSSLTAHIGSNVYQFSRNTITKSPTEFYFGTMENVQMWNVAWNATDVTNDFANIDGVISSQPAANLIARYELTDSLTGLETKPTHTSVDPMLEGITIAFNNGVTSPAFVATDYHTFGVVDGILKDNAIAFNNQISLNMKPMDIAFSEFLNESETNVVSAATPVITEKVYWTEISGTQANGMHSLPGEICNNYASNRTAIAVQQIDTDGYIEGGAIWTTVNALLGFDDTPTQTTSVATVNFGIHFKTDGNINIYESGIVAVTDVTTYNETDIFRVERIGTTVNYYKVVGGTPTLLHTSATASSGTVYGRFFSVHRGCGVHSCNISYTRPAHVMTVGNPTTFTGVYNPQFLTIDASIVENMVINIDGVPATINISNTYFGAMTPPNPGEVTINPIAGMLVFNVADVGAAITGNIITIYDKV